MKTLAYRRALNWRTAAIIPFLCLLFVSLSIYLAGCGGGGGGKSAKEEPTPASLGTVRVTILWPARSRATIAHSPNAAESVRVSATRADGSAAATVTMNRPAFAVNVADTKTLTLTALPLEALTLTFEAFAAPDGSGASLGNASHALTLTASQREISLPFAVESPIKRLALNLPLGRVAPQAGANGIPIGKVTATAYDAADNIVPVRPETMSYRVGYDDNGYFIPQGSVDADGTLFSNKIEPITIRVSETETGISAEAPLALGTPVTLSLRVGGTDAEIPVTPSVAEDSSPLPSYSADKIIPAVILGASANEMRWQKGPVLEGQSFTLTAPTAYGDLQFADWQAAGVGVGNAPTLTIDPLVTASAQLTANYVKRPPDANSEFTPNYIHESDAINYDPPLPNVVEMWNLNDTRIAFVNAEDFTPERRAAAVKGFDWWVRATGGRFRYTLLNDDDTDNANIIVAFTTNVLSARVQPATYIPQGGDNWFPPRGGGLTISRTRTVNGKRIGESKRVILLSATASDSIPKIAAHELMHAYGMSGHSEHIGDVMYPIAYNNYFPTDRDINSLLTILEFSRTANVTRAQRGEPHVTGGKSEVRGIP